MSEIPSKDDRHTTFRYPLRWRVMDVLNNALDRFWPARMTPYTGWVLIMPALLLVGLLVLGLFEMAESSLHTLDRATFMPSEAYTLENYQTVMESATYGRVVTRSVVAAGLTVFFTLLLALPYAYIMVRTTSSAVRKALLVTLFLPFFIGQVVRAYGLLIILGTNGVANNALGLVGVEPIRLLFNFPAVVFGLVQYMLPFAVLMLAPALTAIPRETRNRCLLSRGKLAAKLPSRRHSDGQTRPDRCGACRRDAGAHRFCDACHARRRLAGFHR